MLQVIPPAAHRAKGWARAILVVGTGTMVTAWLATWIALLGAVAHAPAALPGPVQEGIVLGGAALAWRLLVGPLGERRVRAIFVAGAVPVILLLVWVRFYRAWFLLDPHWLAHALQTTQAGAGAPMLACAAGVVALWWAGGRIGAGVLDDYEVFRFFAIGLAGLLGGLLANIVAGTQRSAAEGLGIAVALFFVAAFLTLPLAQLLSAQARGRATGMPLAALDHRWLLTAGGTTLLILGVALLLSASISAALLGAIAAGLGRLPDLLAIILYPIALAGGYLVEALIWVVDRLRGNAGSHQHAPPPLPSSPRATHGRQGGVQLPPLVHLALVWAAIVAITAIVVIVLSRAVGRLGALRQEQAFEEERESVWSWEEAGMAWRSLFRWLRPRRGARRATAGTAGPPRSVREAYLRLIRGGAALGHPRARPETPQEYLGRLRRVPIPDERDAMLLTAAYSRVHYGDEPEQPEDVEQVARAWERLDRAFRQVPQEGGRD
jgi:hypothetical protein